VEEIESVIHLETNDKEDETQEQEQPEQQEKEEPEKEEEEEEEEEEEQDWKYFVTSSFEDVRKIIAEHSEETSTQYCVSRRTRHFAKESTCGYSSIIQLIISSLLFMALLNRNMTSFKTPYKHFRDLSV